ncbi:MAG: 2-hydroxyacyl-CoA dehydratase, partial [Candidatus Eremiobacteraeota bacterium]|nr:2-hydroxyacyl-CoA dehydratase [Candidatus Eremiobacteraeota bacterium]
SGIRLGYAGIPPIFSDIYKFLEKQGARVVYNEVQRQFSMPLGGENLVDQYLKYTYPYSIQDRIKDINTEIKRRNIVGLIHYVQSFCHHQIEDIVLRKNVKIPVLTLEGDRPGPLDMRSRLRLEAFIETLRE